MKKPNDKVKLICEMYNKGLPICDISKQTKIARTTIVANLQRWYFKLYNQQYESFHNKRDKRLQELAEQFKQIYKPFIYNRKDICTLLNCTYTEFDILLRKYNLTHLRLKTYVNQRTLCNVPYENYNEYAEFAKKNNLSMRELACISINNYILSTYKD